MKLSFYKQKLLSEGALNYAIITADNKVNFWKTKKEINAALKKIPAYNHPMVFKKKEKNKIDGHFAVIDLTDNHMAARADKVEDVEFIFTKLRDESLKTLR